MSDFYSFDLLVACILTIIIMVPQKVPQLKEYICVYMA